MKITVLLQNYQNRLFGESKWRRYGFLVSVCFLAGFMKVFCSWVKVMDRGTYGTLFLAVVAYFFAIAAFFTRK